MKCPYCAEEIRDEAILCRFCGAAKADGYWKPPPPPAPPAQPGAPAAGKSNFTIRTAAVFFLVSAFNESLSLTSSILLFGAVWGGTVAVSYHLLYVGLYLAMGIGLWDARSWGYKIMWAGTIFYTVDMARFMLEHQDGKADLLQQLPGYGDILDLVDAGSISNLTTVLSVACWWGFMFYLYRHRSTFEDPAKG